MAQSPEIDRETGEVSKRYLDRHHFEEWMWDFKRRLDRPIQPPRRGPSSSKRTPINPSSHASSSVHNHDASRQHNPYARYRDSQIIPEDP
ncbi:hypothetical protein P9112_012902 [Eukaryota sp. TZLM1-RC]